MVNAELRPSLSFRLHPAVQVSAADLALFTKERLERARDPVEFQSRLQDDGHHLTGTHAALLFNSVGGYIALASFIAELAGTESFSARVLASESLRVRTTGMVHAMFPEARTRYIASVVALLDEVTEDAVAVLLGALPEYADIADGSGSESDIIKTLYDSGFVFERPNGQWARWTMPEFLRSHLLAELAPRDHEMGLDEDSSGCTRDRIVEALLSLGREELVGELMVQARLARRWDVLELLWAQNGLRMLFRFPRQSHTAFANLSEDALGFGPVLRLANATMDTIVAAQSSEALWRGVAHLHRIARNARPLLRDQRSLDVTVALASSVIEAARASGDFTGAARLGSEMDEVIATRQLAGEALHERNRANFQLSRGLSAFQLGKQAEALELLSAASMSEVPLDEGEYLPLVAHGMSAMVHAMRGASADARAALKLAEGASDAVWRGELTRQPLYIAKAILALDVLDRPVALTSMESIGSSSAGAELWVIAANVSQLHERIYGSAAVALNRLDASRAGNALQPTTRSVTHCTFVKLRVEALQAMGKLQRARELILQHGADHSEMQIGHARLHLIAGLNDRAIQLADASLTDPSVCPRDRAELKAIKAAALYQAERGREALASFGVALELCADIGAVLPIALLPGRVRNCLIDETLANPSWERIARKSGIPSAQLLARVRAIGQVFPDSGLLVALSKREQLILEYLNSGESLPEIAGRLTVAVSTIKKQVGAVYRKLGVGTRREALSCAHEIGLLGPGSLGIG